MYLSLSLFFLFIFPVKSEVNNPIVETKYGKIMGKWMKTFWNIPVAAYLGIPYAEPPIGELRFKSPKPWQQSWRITRNATKDGPICAQLNRNKEYLGNEDCLYLNIFVPEMAEGEKVPVLVFIHGGAFILGSNNSTFLQPTYLLNQKVILVTPNYRLGILGFLSSGNQASPGNYGLKDVVQALKWIQENIEVFGGDPSSVTLCGHSAGASLVHHLALSKRTEGLFDKLITQSGTANAPWGIHSSFSAKIRYVALAIQLGCSTDRKIIDMDDSFDEHQYDNVLEDDMRILDCLLEKSPRQLTEQLMLFQAWQDQPYCNFGPTIEPESEDAIVTKHPMSVIENGEFRDIPWINGVVADEGLLKTWELINDDHTLFTLLNRFDEVAPILLEMEEILDNYDFFINKIMDFYFPTFTDDETNDTLSIKTNLTALAGDGLITYWSYEAINTQALKMQSNAYFYEFGYIESYKEAFLKDGPIFAGVGHADELNFLFASFTSPDNPHILLSDDEVMINIMTEMWANFMKTGIPSAQLTPDWEPYRVDFRFMKLGMGRSPDISMQKDFLPIRMEFWRDLMGNVSVSREISFPNINEKEEDADQHEENSTASRNVLLHLFVMLPLFLPIPFFV
ncbi:esterase FE4-like [Chelonus insularis]|uniref:esterase FE4-like n=1 Tax=Chelonus insularis TaxID=460826 RepID=UPI00158D30D8|nr:esterase FE4-like [Chelonus insularis]